MKKKMLIIFVLISTNCCVFGQNAPAFLTGIFTDSRDSHSYSYITIGTQTWMTENLAYLPSVSLTSVGSTVSPVYYVYNYDGSSVSEAKATINYTIYGVLYNWPAATTACPAGWHLPSDEEWKILEKHQGMSDSEADDSDWRNSGTVGGKLKEAGTAHWGSPNTGATNSSGFTALPAGVRDATGGFFNLGSNAYFWTSSVSASSYPWSRNLRYTVDIYRGYYWRHFGFSVRCVKNEYHAAIKLYLEGAYDTGTGTMKTVLNTLGVIPHAQPFNAAPWNYAGTESVVSVPAGVVDWILVELHDVNNPGLANPSNLVPGWPRALFLKSDGTVVNTDGITMPDLGTLTVANKLIIVISHRNHLAVTSATGAILTGSGYFYDFTTAVSQAYTGVYGYKLAGTAAVMAAADMDQDGSIFVSDFNSWAAGFGSAAGYYRTDVDMDGNVFVSDFNKWASNFGLTIISGPISGPVRPKQVGSDR